MKLLSKLSAVFLALACGFGHASAAVISGAPVTVGGKSVDLQGLEWLSLDRTRGYSRVQLESGYDGVFASGWRYATRQETSQLLQSLWGGVQGGSWANGDGANWFFQHLGGGNLWAGQNELHSFFYGASGECGNDATESCRGMYGVSYSNVGYPPTGWFYDDAGLSASAIPMTIQADEMSLSFGSLLVRGSSSVSEPGTIGLVLGALAGFMGHAIARRKQRSQRVTDRQKLLAPA